MVPAFRSRTALPFAAALLAVSLTSGLAAAGGTPAACTNPGQVVTQTEQKFSAIAPGAVIAVGNTLGLSKAPGLNAPGTLDSIGTFIAIDGNASTEPGWFAGTTGDWMENGSTATLELPSEATILHAQLVWGGSYADPTGLGSLEANLDDPVVLRFGGQDFEIAPEAGGIDVELGDLFRYYARSADVTDIVTAEGALTVGRVPAKQSDLIDTLHAAGWTLLVAYRDQTQPIRNLTIYFGGEFVDENTTQDYRFSGFCASPSGDLTGSAIITALEGDANRQGDVLCIAPTESPAAGDFVGLSSPNNPANNFFASQINDELGELDESGTFGDRNHDAFAATNTSGGRQGWDITQVELSSGDGSLEPDQTGATMRTATASDSYLPMSAAFSIDVLAPLFVPGPGNGTEVSVDSAQIGDTFTVTVELTNTGAAAVDNLVFTMPVESGLTLTSFTSDGQPGDITGDPVQQGELNSGVAEGTLAPNENRVVVATFEVTGAPSGEQFLVQPSWGYDWIMCTGQAAIDGNFAGEVDSVLFIETTGPTTTTGAGGDDSGATTTTSTGTDGTGGAGGGGDDSDGEDEDGEDEDGAGGGDAGTFVASGSGLCAATPGAPSRAGFFALGLAAIGAALGLRRRRG